MKKRILITATSIEELGGVSIQAKHLLDTFSLDENVEMSFVPSNPRLTKSLSWLQKIKGLRTIFTSLKFWALLISKVRKNDIVHVFSVAMTGYIFATLPPLFIAKLFRKQTILHYHSGELDDT